MLDTAVNQLRYASGILRGRIRPATLSHIVDDLVATLAEFGAPGEDSSLLPGQGGGLDPEFQKTITSRSLRRTAEAAAGQTAYYRRLFAESGLDPAALDLDSWTDVPPTRKTALRGMPAAFVSSRARPVLMASTTGTTGTPTTVWFSADELEVVFALGAIAAAVVEGLRPHHVVAHATSSRATLPLLAVTESTRRTGAALTQIGTIDPALALERLAAPLNLPAKAAQVTHLSCSTSYLAALVAEAERGGWQAGDFGLQTVWSGGEVLSAALRARVTETLGAQVVSSYVATEILPVGAAACEQGHMHYPAEFGHVELVDPETGAPARPGEIATLVVTPFVPYRECTLLLRYVTGDLVRVLDTTPDCDLAAMPGSSDILGRYSGPLSVAVPTRAILDVLDAERAVPLPARYSLVEDAAGPLLHVAVDRPSAALASRLEGAAAVHAPGLAGIVLHDDPAGLPSATPLRADLLERSFELAGRA